MFKYYSFTVVKAIRVFKIVIYWLGLYMLIATLVRDSLVSVSDPV